MFTKAVGLTSLETAFARHLEHSVLVSQGFTRSHGPKDVLLGGGGSGMRPSQGP